MPETEEEKQARWKAAAAKAFYTPQMMHALNMSKQQSQNTYKEGFVKSKGKVSAVADTPELLRVKKQQDLISQSKYKSEFEKNKGKFTQVADDPETLRIGKVTKQQSNLQYTGKGPRKSSRVRKYEELIKQNSDNKTSKENGGSPVKRTEPKSPESSSPEEIEAKHESIPEESEVGPTEEPPQECCDLTLNFSRQAISDDDSASDKGDNDPLDDSAEQQGSRSYEVEDTRDGYKSDDQHLNDDNDNDDLFAGLPKATPHEDEGQSDDLFAGLPTEEEEEKKEKEEEEKEQNEEENIEEEQDNELTGEEEPPAESSLDDFYASLA